jgi:hypothetical protein
MDMTLSGPLHHPSPYKLPEFDLGLKEDLNLVEAKIVNISQMGGVKEPVMLV